MLAEDIRDILFNDWDPILVSPNQNLRDEYDRLIPPLSKLIREGAPVDALAQVLERAEADIETYVSPEVRLKVAEKLRSLAPT